MHCPLMHAVHTTTRHIVHTVPPHNGNASGHVLHLPHVQKRAGGGFLSRFDAIHAPPPPLHAKASRRWTFIVFPRCAHHVHLPRMQTRAGGGFIAFQRRSPQPPSHAKASRRWFSTTFLCPPPPSHAKASRRMELYGVLTPFSPPSPPLHAN